MTSYLGKRKRRHDIDVEDDLILSKDGIDRSIQYQYLLKFHFETTFDPLPEYKHPQRLDESFAEITDGESECTTDWEGLSENESNVVEIVQHDTAEADKATASRKELRTFMVADPSMHPFLSLC